MARGQYKRTQLPWGAMRDDTRIVRVRELLSQHDHDTLWSLVAYYVTLRGQAGAATSSHTLRAYRTGLRAFLEFVRGKGLAGEALCQAVLAPDRDLGAEYLSYLVRRGRSPATVNARRAAAAAFYRALRWAGATSADPFGDVPAVRDHTARSDKRHPYDPADLERMLAACRCPEEVALIQLGARGGLRISEALALRWREVDLAARRLVVVSGKGGKLRRVRLFPKLHAALVALEPRGEYVLPWRRTETARGVLRRVCERAGVAYIAYHALRHYCGTALYRETRDLATVANHLGHASVTTSQIYAKWSDGLIDALDI